MGTDDFAHLEIRCREENDKFHYFYHADRRSLIKDFVLVDQPQVATLCRVTLIKSDDHYLPRIRFWKKQRGKLGDNVATEDIPDTIETRPVKASVDTGNAHANFWTLINYLQSLDEVSTTGGVFRIISPDSAALVEVLQAQDRATVLEAVGTLLQGTLTRADLQLLTRRRAQLEYFHRLLHEDGFFATERTRLSKGEEALWQSFFEENPWIFGYGLNLISCQSFDDAKLEQATTGHSLFQGAGKRSDAVLRSRGLISSLLFCEIKIHTTPLLSDTQYRKPDVYQVSKALSGAVSQVQKTADKALRGMTRYIEEHYDPDGTPTGIEFSTVRPKQVVVIGSLDQLSPSGQVNQEQLSCFEFYRRGILDVEIITFDELYQRAKFIVEDV